MKFSRSYNSFVYFDEKFCIWICESFKDNWILHLLTFFFYTTGDLFIRKFQFSPKTDFVSTNRTLRGFHSFPLAHTQILSISISDSSKANTVLHLHLFFFHSQDEFFIRKIFILSKLNSSSRIKFCLFFSFFRRSDPNSASEFVTVWKRIQFCVSSFFCSTLRTNFSYGKF